MLRLVNYVFSWTDSVTLNLAVLPVFTCLHQSTVVLSVVACVGVHPRYGFLVVWVSICTHLKSKLFRVLVTE